MNVLLWHVHGSWTTSFVQGRHTYLLPVVAGRGADGRGRAQTWDWPANAVEISPGDLADAAVDVVIVQRPIDVELATAWLGDRRPGRDLPMVWLEHNAPQGHIADMRHPAADRDDVTAVVHVTHANDLFWDCGDVPTRIVEHGIVDPGHRYTGELAHIGVVVNEPERRGRVAGTDLLELAAGVAPVDLFGMATADLARRRGFGGAEDLPQEQLHRELARRRVYFHPFRWTSLGLSLIEAMHLGMPVVALATTEAPDAVPGGAGVVTNRLDDVCKGLRRFLTEPELARRVGTAARQAALDRYGLARFLDDWDRLLGEVTP